MNRIILIGNGFDRAHGLKTSYKDFIDDFWWERIKEIREVSHGSEYNNEDLGIYLRTDTNSLRMIVDTGQVLKTLSSLQDAIKRFEKSVYNPKIEFQIKNKFLEYISRVSSLQNWVDIEDAYHKFLNAIHRDNEIVYGGKNYEYTSVKDLHKDFENVRKALEDYLMRVAAEKVGEIEGIKEKIYSESDPPNFIAKGLDKIAQEQYVKIVDHYEHGIKYKVAKDYDGEYHNFSREEMLDSIKASLMGSRLLSEDDDLSINKLLFLNFNYTNLEKLYIDAEREDDIIHIHGELNNPDNPMIFGYGDELGEEYKVLEKLNDNEYLENIKSIKYLETNNYKKLLSFVDSEEYQIFIFGHSCGNSDRTLLNRLFGHENCVSIKVFYHGTKEKNNYSDVIRNISRNFNDKTSFREKVVNKKDSVPLPQASKAK